MDILTPKTYCVSVDGSKYSQYGWEVVCEELYKKGDKVVVTHIYNEEKSNLPYECQQKTIYLKYRTLCIGRFLPGFFTVVVEPRDKDSVHALQNLKKVADKENADAIVIGFFGHKANLEKKELTKGLVYAIKYITRPMFVIKERSIRKNKESGGFTWLFCIVNKYSRSFKAFNLALPHIDPDKDVVKGINLYRGGDGHETKEIEAEFFKKCGECKIKNSNFSYIEYDRTLTPGKQLSDIINFGEEYIDFICLGHNTEKYDDFEKAPAVEVIKLAQVNIFVSPLSI